MKTRIDIDRLRLEIRDMTRDSVLYQALKEELTELGHWRNQPRGNPIKGYRALTRQDTDAL